MNGEIRTHTPNSKRQKTNQETNVLEKNGQRTNGGGVKKNKNSQKRRKPKFIMKHAQQRKTIKKR